MTPSCDLKIGDRVKVGQACIFADDFRDEYRVVGIDWDYRGLRGINITIASEDDIRLRHGGTDGFAPEDLVLMKGTLS